MRLTAFLAFLVVTLVVNCNSFVSAERNANDDNFAENDEVNALREERAPEAAAKVFAAEEVGKTALKAEGPAVTEAVARNRAIKQAVEKSKNYWNIIMKALRAQKERLYKFRTPAAENAPPIDKDLATAGDKSKVDAKALENADPQTSHPIPSTHEPNPQTSHPIPSTHEPNPQTSHPVSFTHEKPNPQTSHPIPSTHEEPNAKNPKETTIVDGLEIPTRDKTLLERFVKFLKSYKIDPNLIRKADRGELDKLLIQTFNSASSSVTKNVMIAIAAGALGVAVVYTLFNLPSSKPVHSTNTVGTTSSGAA